MLYVVTRRQPPCPYCVSAKKFLDTNKMDYEEIQLEEVIDTIKEIGVKTVPAIFSSKPLSMDSFLGGFDYLKNKKPE